MEGGGGLVRERNYEKLPKKKCPEETQIPLILENGREILIAFRYDREIFDPVVFSSWFVAICLYFNKKMFAKLFSSFVDAFPSFGVDSTVERLFKIGLFMKD